MLCRLSIYSILLWSLTAWRAYNELTSTGHGASFRLCELLKVNNHGDTFILKNMNILNTYCYLLLYSILEIYSNMIYTNIHIANASAI